MENLILLKDSICFDNDDFYKWGAVLYDCDSKEVYTTTYGHGTDLDRTALIDLNKAVDTNKVSINKIKECIIKEFALSFEKINLSELACIHGINNPIEIPITIVKGRKGKGKKGTLIYGEKKRNYYGWGQYQEIYDEYAYILLDGTHEIIKVNSFDYLQVEEDFINRYNQALSSEILAKVELSSLSWLYAYKMSYSSCDRQNLRDCIEKYSRLAESYYKPTETILSAIEEYKEECNKIAHEKREALKKEVMPSIIEWVINNTDKKGDEIEKLALHIFNKRY